jgi:UDP-N-acetylglucosamine 2-epimerase (non-hydrolysing)
MKVRILCVAGARPNFMKIAPLLRALSAREIFDPKLVHTGQHYDSKLSQVFFDDLGIRTPDIHLDVGSGSHSVQTAEIMKRFEPVAEEQQPHAVLVVGDVNSTIACALVAAKLQLAESFRTQFGIRRRPLIIHVEAGLRSFDDDMPEEVNRRLTDCISDILYVSDPAGLTNLAHEGVAPERVVMVGNVMIDTLLAAREQAMKSTVLERLKLTPGSYGVVTLHRPSNVDDAATLSELVSTLDAVAREMPLVFPVHPRTRARLDTTGVAIDQSRWKVIEPVGYHDFLHLLSSARVVLTDSGGIQEETTVLGVPCITLRENTERPVTIHEGTNQLTGTDRDAVLRAFHKAISGGVSGRVPRFWDGKAAERIAEHLEQVFTGSVPAE